jgi:hypothetical protein
MAQSVKLSDGSYIDASAVYDVNAGKTQQDVNDSKLDTTGGTITGDITMQQRIYGKAVSDTIYAQSVIILPWVPFATLGTKGTGATKEYFKELLKWIKANCEAADTYIGRVNPNSQGNAIIHLYRNTSVDSSGYPQYASGLFVHHSGELYTFGFNNYTYFFNKATLTAQ